MKKLMKSSVSADRRGGGRRAASSSATLRNGIEKASGRWYIVLIMSFVSYVKNKYLRLCARIVHEDHSPEYIARGWAIGMFYGCAVPFGFQLILSLPTAFLLRGSKIGSVVGTLITNHFTIFIIYPVQCWVGNHLLGGRLSHDEVSVALSEMLNEQSFQSLLRVGGELLAAFFVGGALFALVMTPLTYSFVKSLVIRRRARKSKTARK